MSGLPNSENPFHPPMALVAAGSLAALSPQNSKADHPFCMVIGRCNSFLFKKYPEVGDFPLQPAGKDTRCILIALISGDELH